jgi:hypothetical protein
LSIQIAENGEAGADIMNRGQVRRMCGSACVSSTQTGLSHPPGRDKILLIPSPAGKRFATLFRKQFSRPPWLDSPQERTVIAPTRAAFHIGFIGPGQLIGIDGHAQTGCRWDRHPPVMVSAEFGMVHRNSFTWL